MKITKRQLRRLIKEETSRAISEAWGSGAGPHTSDYAMLEFAQAWSQLGPQILEQVMEVLQSWGEGGHDPEWTETVMMQNPAAIESALGKLGPSLNKMKDTSDEAFDIYSALEGALEIFEEDKNPKPPGPKLPSAHGDD